MEIDCTRKNYNASADEKPKDSDFNSRFLVLRGWSTGLKLSVLLVFEIIALRWHVSRSTNLSLFQNINKLDSERSGT